VDRNDTSSLDRYQTEPLAVAGIFYDPDFNCRGRFTLMSLQSLAESIEQRGLDFPVVVQPIEDTGLHVPFKWRLLAGFRRFVVFRDILKREMIPATIRRGLTDEQAVMLNFQENSERTQLTTLEESQWLAKHFAGRSLRDVSMLVGRDTRWIHQRRRLASMPSEVQSQFSIGLLTLLDIDSLAKLVTAEEQIKTAELMIEAKRRRDTECVTKLRKARRFRPRKTKKDIWRMNGRLMQIGITGLVTRLLAWTAGDVTDEEIEQELAHMQAVNGDGWVEDNDVKALPRLRNVRPALDAGPSPIRV
jgi:ParB/RepB/Spo0J family partition protein